MLSILSVGLYPNILLYRLNIIIFLPTNYNSSLRLDSRVYSNVKSRRE